MRGSWWPPRRHSTYSQSLPRAPLLFLPPVSLLCSAIFGLLLRLVSLLIPRRWISFAFALRLVASVLWSFFVSHWGFGALLPELSVFVASDFVAELPFHRWVFAQFGVRKIVLCSVLVFETLNFSSWEARCRQSSSWEARWQELSTSTQQRAGGREDQVISMCWPFLAFASYFFAQFRVLDGCYSFVYFEGWWVLDEVPVLLSMPCLG